MDDEAYLELVAEALKQRIDMRARAGIRKPVHADTSVAVLAMVGPAHGASKHARHLLQPVADA